MNSEILQVQKKYLGEKIKNAQNHLKCPKNQFLGIFEKYEICMNSTIKNAQNRLRCPENYFLGIFENMKFS